MESPDLTAELIRRTQAGETEAFGELVILHAPTLLRFVAGLAGLGETEREDVVQEAFVRAYERLEKFQQGGSFLAWVAGFARNIVCEHLAKRRRQAAVRERLIEVTAADAQIQQARECPSALAERRLEMLQRCVQALPEKMRSILRLHYHEGLDLSQIAAALSRPLGTVKSWLHRTRRELKNCVDHKLVSLGEAAE